MIEVEAVSKRFGKTDALSAVDLHAEQGKVLALLGPNGAGKTTLVRVLTTLLRPDSGTARVAGYDVVTEAGPLRGAIGLAGQYAAVDELLTGRENLELVGLWYHLEKREYRRRAADVLERFELTGAERLAHQIVVIDRGAVIAHGTSAQLKAQLGGDTLEARVTNPADLDRAAALLAEITDGRSHTDRDQRRISIPTSGGTKLLIAAGERLQAAQVPLDDLGIRHPSLDDVFLAVTGRTASDRAADGQPHIETAPHVETAAP